ncbi:hypothetical protein RBSH_00627 [Rhodopirellula baltica SH28]|uniref:Uncharacterized protein n=1 Tax=Rhodopirellula baltica SH28 TaxID=993517 RepID=K5EDD1_RHOBT|nr:hypothetical protein RBSH_00627 [Rhodopirellula baltica SH28]
MRYFNPESVVVNSVGASGSSGPGELDRAEGLHPIGNVAKANTKTREALENLDGGFIVSIGLKVERTVSGKPEIGVRCLPCKSANEPIWQSQPGKSFPDRS